MSARPFTAATSGRVRRHGLHAGEQLADGGEEHAGLAEGGAAPRRCSRRKAEVGADDEDGALGEQFAVLVEAGRRRGAGRRRSCRCRGRPRRPGRRGAGRGWCGPGRPGWSARCRPCGRCARSSARRAARRRRTRSSWPVRVSSPRSRISSWKGVTVRPSLVMCRAAAQPHRACDRWPGRRAGDTGLPVDQDRGAFGVVGAQSDAADVVALSGGEVDPAEGRGAVHRVERGEQPGGARRPGCPAQTGLLGGVALGERRR